MAVILDDLDTEAVKVMGEWSVSVKGEQGEVRVEGEGVSRGMRGIPQEEPPSEGLPRDT